MTGAQAKLTLRLERLVCDAVVDGPLVVLVHQRLQEGYRERRRERTEAVADGGPG